ncbi:MAG: DUF4386 domain-containing protein [Solidesulfovibrio sp.]
MTNHPVEISQRKIALISGFTFLIMTLASIFGIFFVFKNIQVTGDATATANNILASEMLFRLGLCSLIIVLICDVIAAWTLYIFLKRVNKSLSLLTMLFRLLYATILGTALFNLVIALHYLKDSAYLAAFETHQLQAQALLFINVFFDNWAIGLIVFGFHLLVLGYLVFKSGYIPKILGVLLIIGSFGYLIQNFALFLLPNFENNKALFETVLALPMAIGELSFAFWLLLKGGKGQAG